MRSNTGVDSSPPDFTLPGFDIEQLVGFGGAGEVWRARERATGELVALRRVRLGAALDVQSQRQLRRDAAVLATVWHANVVRLRATAHAATGLALVYDYVEGGSLFSLLATRGTLTAGEVVAVGAPLAVALAEAHAHGVVHGNITPANVLFDLAGEPLLADLGVAALIGRAGGADATAARFADPAAAAGASGAASDVHGLAAVCHAALTGGAPYRDGALVPLRAVAVDGVPPTLVEAIEAAMNADFRARPDAAGFACALYAAATPRTVLLTRSAPTASPSESPSGSPSRVAGRLRAGSRRAR